MTMLLSLEQLFPAAVRTKWCTAWSRWYRWLPLLSWARAPAGRHGRAAGTGRPARRGSAVRMSAPC